MNCKVVIVGLVAFAAGLPGAAVDVSASDRLQINNVGVTRTLGTYRYYGYAEYRCRKFSTVCGYYRPVYYARYWSTTYPIQKSGTTGRDAPAQLGRYRVNDIELGSRKTFSLERSGGFTRIDAPGNATRWVLTSMLNEAK